MAERCPRCYADLPEDARWVCPACGYTLHTPGVSKWGLLFIFLGLVLLVGYVMGPSAVGLTSGAIPTQLADLAITYFTEMIALTFAFGFLLVLVGAAILRSARRAAAVSA